MLLVFSAFMIFQSRNRSTGIIFYKFYCLRNHFLVVVVAPRVMIVINSQKNIFNEDYTSLTQIIVPTWSCLDWTEKQLSDVLQTRDGSGDGMCSSVLTTEQGDRLGKYSDTSVYLKATLKRGQDQKCEISYLIFIKKFLYKTINLVPTLCPKIKLALGYFTIVILTPGNT